MCIKHNHTWSELRNFLLYRRRGYMYMYSLTSPYGHLYNTDTSLSWTVHLVPEMPKIIHPYPYNMDTSAKRTLGSVPLVSILKRFDCTCMSSLCCLSPSVCLMSLFKSQYVACWNFTLTWPRQCQVLCSQWLALLNYIMYLWYLKLAANLVSWLLSLLLLFFWRNLCPIWTFLMGFCTICSRRSGSMPAATGLIQKTM